MIGVAEQTGAPSQARPIQGGEPSVIVFDVATAPAPADVIDRYMPEVEAPSNYKDPAKIDAYKAEQREKFIQKAALSPLTGQVLAIGLWADGRYRRFICTNEPQAEADCIRWLWDLVGTRTVLVGFNSNSFDLPFLYRRSWALGIDPPLNRMDQSGRFSHSLHVDLLDLWRLGDRNVFISLDAVARFTGLGAKSGDGEFFHQVLKAFPEEAEAYLENDVRLTFALAKRLGAINSDLIFSVADGLATATTSEEDY
jgi:DNA polymerase elongation subunit (family B)